MKGHRPRYILVFLVTLCIFMASWSLSFILNQKKISDLQSDQDEIAVNILSSEKEFDQADIAACDVDEQTTFSNELQVLANKISYLEQNFGNANEIIELKKQYTLLEVRDFLLTKRVTEKCKLNPVTIFYFYGTEVACPDCVRQGYVLDVLRQENKDVRVYAFDYHLDLSTIKALRDIYQIGETLPALVINGTTYSGFQTLDELRNLIR